MTSRISGIFRRDTPEVKENRDKVPDTIQEAPASSKVPETGVASSSSSTTTTKGPSTGLTTINGSASDKVADKKLPTDDHGAPKRFYMNDDGTHGHYLKVAKRHQKIKDMVRSLWSKKEGTEEQPLTLMHDWVIQKKTEAKASADLKGGPNHSMSLVEKYGKCQEIVGHGAFGIVRVAHKQDAKDPRKELLYAVKEFHKRPSESAKKYQKRLTSEFCLSSSMQHPNVIQTLDLLQDDKGDYCEVMEFCAGGDLYTLILAAGNLEVIEADCYFKQLMRGVEYMHEMGVAHRDLKPENLLLTCNGALKITDFGNGECFRMAWEKEAHMTAGLCGSAPYIAPEEYVDKEFDPRAVDVWACGVIYMAMRTGRHLWRVAQKGEDEFFTRYLEDRREESGFRPIEILRRRQCRNVIYSVLDPNPNRRLTAHQVLQSEWVKDVKVCRAGEEGY
ncbi:Pkinase-domain-containing protein [Microthyrium microscopicum]|uniref:non-specific serine/threonine protein kinase n=1 Tax=Microthyrium microscopicum TaxID=703497 RepID=A0A6A6UE94_9PEZI|nr:Pkinase-domain-containing protein [Microthyrium microscopicum]